MPGPESVANSENLRGIEYRESFITDLFVDADDRSYVVGDAREMRIPHEVRFNGDLIILGEQQIIDHRANLYGHGKKSDSG